MFATRYFPDRMFAPRHFPKVGADVDSIAGTGTATILRRHVGTASILRRHSGTATILRRHSGTASIRRNGVATDYFDIGDTATAAMSFLVDGAATNPTTVTAKVTKPDGTTDAYVYGTDSELTRPSTGNYELELDLDYDTDAVGIWYIQWRGTGACKVVEESSLTVRTPHVLP